MNAPEWVVTQFAVGRVGAVLVNINPAYRLHELEETLRAADVETLIVGRRSRASDFVADGRAALPRGRRRRLARLVVGEAPALRRLIARRPARAGLAAWATWTRRRPRRTRGRERAAVKPGDVYNIQFTSGTTGLAQGGDAHAPQRADERLLHRPAAALHGRRPGLRAGAVLPLLRLRAGDDSSARSTARRWSSPAPSFDAGATLAAVASERCTSLYGVPTMFVAELDHPDRSPVRPVEPADRDHVGQPLPACR